MVGGLNAAAAAKAAQDAIDQEAARLAAEAQARLAAELAAADEAALLAAVGRDRAAFSAASGDLIATAHCERRGRSISFVRGEVRAEDGTLVALATGTFKLVARQPARG